MGRQTVTAGLSSVIEFIDAGIRMPRRLRRGGGGRRQQLRRMAGDTKRHEVWRLRDVTMAVGPGESVAIVGGRGSGRETLLRLAAGTLIPDEGLVRRRESVVPMIQVGRAFDNTFTVRQNVYVVGGLLGMTPDDVGRRLTEIVRFAGAESVLDRYLGAIQPGLRARLAWAVPMFSGASAFAIEQALVVGERAFRQACWDRVDRLRADGATFLIASDSSRQFRRFCDRAVVLDAGEVKAQTSVAEAIAMLRESRRKNNEVEDDTDGEDDGDRE